MTCQPATGDGWAAPVAGWPSWLWSVPYDATRHPLAGRLSPVEYGANCQRFGHAVLELFGLEVPPLRSSDLWASPVVARVDTAQLQPLDLVFFNDRDGDPFGAHVAVWMADDELLHLCREVGYPAVWSLADFAARDRYRAVIGGVRLDPS